MTFEVTTILNFGWGLTNVINKFFNISPFKYLYDLPILVLFFFHLLN